MKESGRKMTVTTVKIRMAFSLDSVRTEIYWRAWLGLLVKGMVFFFLFRTFEWNSGGVRETRRDRVGREDGSEIFLPKTA